MIEALIIVAIVVLMVLGALVLDWAKRLEADAHGRGWLAGFNDAQRLHEQTSRRWQPKPWKTPDGPSAPGNGPGQLNGSTE